jgi:hypothetical protein
MARKSNHIVPSSQKEGWAVKKSGSTRVSRSFDTKEKAIKYGRELSKKEHVELFIHRKDGTIQNRNSYGKDPQQKLQSIKLDLKISSF